MDKAKVGQGVNRYAMREQGRIRGRKVMKNIIILSDGTGNGAAKRHKTNVWRLYQALDLHGNPPGHTRSQIAFYDDGVGAKEFLPLKLLGGIFGWGLKRNVIELYKFLCRTYEENEEDGPDKIFLFGFSRGAFTVRMLAGMIEYCGLYKNYQDEEDLQRTAQRYFSAYRLQYRKGYLTQPFRRFMNGNHRPCNDKNHVKPCVEFIGVWDTVEAYGFPIDELARLWDRFILPLRFVSNELPGNVHRACHALSVDDERRTFHPVLWDEKSANRKKCHHKADDKEGTARIEQVWFAGVHSDVGGGYPRINLALVTLDWMISRIEHHQQNQNGLLFMPNLRKDYRRGCDWHGVQHDSRSGLSAYYRYQPRDIAKLSRCKIQGKPKIHRGVLERIKQNSVPYAPTALPAEYEVIATPPGRNKTKGHYEPGVQAKRRAEAMERARDLEFWRRWLYAAFLLATSITAYFLWTGQAWRTPCWIAIPVVFGVLGKLKGIALRATHTRASNAWAKLKGKRVSRRSPSATTRLRRILSRPPWTGLRWLLPIVVFAAILIVAASAINRTAFFFVDTFCQLCGPTVASELRDEREIKFDISNPCYATGIQLKKGVVYHFRVEPAAWKDGSATADADGFSSLRLVPFVLSRRHIFEPWLKLMGRVGDCGSETFAIGSIPKYYKAKSDGELFLYVNDAVFGVPGDRWALPYGWRRGKNEGTAKVTVSR